MQHELTKRQDTRPRGFGWPVPGGTEAWGGEKQLWKVEGEKETPGRGARVRGKERPTSAGPVGPDWDGGEMKCQQGLFK